MNSDTRELFEEKVAEALAAPVAGSRVAARRAARLETVALDNPVPAPSAPVADTPSEIGMVSVSVLPESSLYHGSQTTKVRRSGASRSRAAVLAFAAAASGVAVLGASPSLAGTDSQQGNVEVASLKSTIDANDSVASMTITVKVDGKTHTVKTGAATIGDALTEAGIVVGDKDQVNIPLASPVVEGAVVEIVRVETQTVTEEEKITHGTVREEDPELLKGTEKVATEGVDGLIRKTYELTLVDGRETARTLTLETEVTRMVDEVIKVGTKEPEPEPTQAPVQQTQPAQQQVPQTPVPAGSAQDIARQQVYARGWGEDQFQCLVTLWNRESNWNYRASNPSSGAYGIPQALPGSKMASAGADWMTNPATQIKWGLGYIAGRYGTPCNALGHSYSTGWY